MSFNIRATSISLMLAFNQLLFSAASVAVAVPKEEIVFARLFGTQPQAIRDVVANFKVAKDPENFGVILSKWTNRLLLYGPPGNGKTTTAQEIAKLTKSKFIHIPASTLVTKYQGSGAEAIKDIFKEAVVSTDQGESVVVFLDEIDAIVSKNTPSNHQDTRAAMQTLCCEVLEQENNNNLLIIVATNVRESFHEAFDSRFPANCAIEMKNPDQESRKDIIQKSFMLNGMPKCNEKIIKKCDVAIDEKFREKHAGSFSDFLESLKGIEEKSIEFGTTKTKTAEEEKPEVLKNLIIALKNSIKRFQDDNAKEMSGLGEHKRKALDKYIDSINNYLAKLEKWVGARHIHLGDGTLNDYAEKTNEFSVRTIVKFMEYVNGLPLIKNPDGSVSLESDLINEHLKKIREDLAKNKAKWSEDDRQMATDLQAKHNLHQTYKDGAKKCLTQSCLTNIRNNPTYIKLRKELFPVQKNSNECGVVTDLSNFAPDTVYSGIQEDLQALKNGTMLHGNQRLFIASSGNGKRSFAKEYAIAGNGIFKELDASAVIHGYINEGSGFLSHLVNTVLDEAEQADKNLIVVYVSDIDQTILSFGEQYNFNHKKECAALAQFILESGQYNNNNEKQKIIFIFGAQDQIPAYVTPNKINGESWWLNNDYQKRRGIFKYYFSGKDEIASLQAKTAIFNVMAIARIEEEWKKADALFWQEYEKYRKGGLFALEDDLGKARIKSIELSKRLSQLHKAVSESYLSSSKTGGAVSYCIDQHQHNKKLEFFFLSYVELYEKTKELEMQYVQDRENNNRKVMGRAKELRKTLLAKLEEKDKSKK